MKKELRRFPRVKTDLKVGYEFVKWYESKLDTIKKPNYAIVHDISVGGIGIAEMMNVNPGMLRKLKRGTRKARLAIFLYKDKPPLMTFARLIWSDQGRSQGIQRYGFVFIDVSPHFYAEIIKYVHRLLKLNK